MPSKREPEPDELLDAIDQSLDRLKVLYEQYFMGIQKQPPTFIHTDVERKLRDATQLQMRNTRLRYRLATVQQKFGAYNSYWRRTLRQIENGTYVRNLAKVGREAAKTGAAIPQEILAAMPKRMRDQVMRDREQAVAIAQRQKRTPAAGERAPAGPPLLPPEPMYDEPATVRSDEPLDLEAFHVPTPAGAAASPPPRATGSTIPVPMAPLPMAPLPNLPSGAIRKPGVPPPLPPPKPKPKP